MKFRIFKDLLHGRDYLHSRRFQERLKIFGALIGVDFGERGLREESRERRECLGIVVASKQSFVKSGFDRGKVGNRGCGRLRSVRVGALFLVGSRRLLAGRRSR